MSRILRASNHVKSEPGVHTHPSHPGESVRQEFQEDCDLNKIVERAKRGIAPQWVARGTPRYGDFSKTPTLAEAFMKVTEATEAFMTLPAQLRWELGNDPRRINEMTEEQVLRFKLAKLPAEPAVDGVKGGTPLSSDDAHDEPSEGSKSARKQKTQQ